MCYSGETSKLLLKSWIILVLKILYEQKSKKSVELFLLQYQNGKQHMLPCMETSGYFKTTQSHLRNIGGCYENNAEELKKRIIDEWFKHSKL